MSLPRGIRYETLPERLLQGKAFSQHIENFLWEWACVCSGVASHVSVCLDGAVARMCARLFYVGVFYDSECIPFGLHAIYMCALYFFSKRRGPVCTRTERTCVGEMLFDAAQSVIRRIACE